MVHKYYFDLANEENCLKIQFSVRFDNFEQYFDTSLIITLDDLQNFGNKTKSIHSFEKQQTKTFCDFWVFQYGLWQEKKIRKRRKSTVSFVKQRSPVANIQN